ncbi:MAG: leukocidin family pore-forming toxin [Alcanivoracaceae bacterium]|nr:leukocidin family pore-forming toxin [Alcanivoracaceae bacterium]
MKNTQKLFLAHSTSDSVVSALGELFLINSIDDSDQAKGRSDLEGSHGLVIDCSISSNTHESRQSEAFEAAHRASVPVILLNVGNGQQIASMIGIGFKSDCVVVRWHNGNAVIDNLDNRSRINFASSVDNPIRLPFSDLEPKQVASVIKRRLLDSLPEIDDTNMLSSTIGVLPKEQTYTAYVRCRTHPEYLNKVSSAEIIFKVTLVASYDPPCKYLQITTCGVGVNPNLAHDHDTDRGYFTKYLDIFMKAHDSRLTFIKTSPGNKNEGQTYTSTVSYTAGVNVAEKGSSYNSSYEITSSITQEKNDFDIINDSSDVEAKWTIQQSRTDFFGDGDVKTLPLLAKKLLTPACTALWYVKNDFEETVNLSIYFTWGQRHCWVHNGYFSNDYHTTDELVNDGYFDSNVNWIDFSKVSAT